MTGFASGKVAVVTGAGAGIGQAIALRLAREGAGIAVVDVDMEAARHTLKLVQEIGGQAVALQADVSRPEEVDYLFQRTAAELGGVDILVNNAGVTHPAVSILELDLEHLERVFAVGFKGVYLCSRRGGKEMVARGSGCIVNISSIAGLTPLRLPVYGPMKSAVNMLTKVLAMEWAGQGVRVNAVAPAYVLTPLMQKLIESGQRNPEAIVARTPMKAMLSPADVAQAVAFLCSPAASRITGVVLPVDGGWLCDGGWSLYGR